MACYVVTFDPIGLQAAEHIRSKLKEFGSYCPINSYSWAITTTWSAVQIRDALKAVSPASRIFVVRSGTEGAWLNPFGDANSEWLKKNL